MRIKIDHTNIWFASDYHFSHKNIIKYDNRPFETVEEMNQVLIDNWNEVVGEKDVVFYLGDLSFDKNIENTKKILKQLKGKIHFIMGNHDDDRIISNLGRFETVNDYVNLTVTDKNAPNGKQQIMMMHFPILSWDKAHRGAWHIHGHEHHSFTNNSEYDWYYERKVVDIGCNGWDYKPVSYEELKTIMDNKDNGIHH
jgi:calcineurin-like phosphoesterase family protein